MSLSIMAVIMYISGYACLSKLNSAYIGGVERGERKISLRKIEIKCTHLA